MIARVALAAAAALVVLLAVVFVGRWERERRADRQNDGIERVYATIGELDAHSLAGFRFLEAFQCLIYERGGRQFALELCVDWEGRAIEAIDRRADDVEIWSLREDPGNASVRVDRRRFERVIEAMCEDCDEIFRRGREPLGRAR